MKPKFVGDGYNRKEKYAFIWAWYENTTVGTVYTNLEKRAEEEKDIFMNGNERYFPLTIKPFGDNVLIIQRLRGETSGENRTPILCNFRRLGSN